MNTPEAIKETVKREYNQIIQDVENQGIEWWRSRVCESIYAGIRDTYPDMNGYVDDANLGLGCGFPVKYSDIKVGDAVLDLGCAAGIDSFIARQVVGEQGSVIGMDITPFLIERARRTAEKLGYQNVIFIEGDIEAIPLVANQIDVVISNGVFSLVPHKERVFAEMYRVLKPEAHFCIADLVRRSKFPDTLRIAAEQFTGCLNGISHQDEYLRLIVEAGFKNVALREERRVPLPDNLLNENLNMQEKIAFLEANKGLFAITIYGVK